MIIIDLNKENWNSEVIKSKMLTLVYFWHEGCPWCRLFNPIFEKIAQEYEGKLKFTKFNIFANESNAELAENLGIMATPTIVFFCNGLPIMQIVGAMTEEEFRKMINEILERHKVCIEKSTKLSYIM